MKSNKLFLILGVMLAAFVIVGFTACSDSSDGGDSGLSYNDNPVASFAGTRWVDDILPESEILFESGNSVTLTGRYWGQIKPAGLAGTHSYETASDLSGDKVEPAVWVLTDTTNRKGFELYYYKAGAGKHQRLVVYVGAMLQPREFYLH
ncbi:hypothetical protein [Leadbettera azotonutricia]|uniref:Putative lipoprotein n=1 Tax=Leadbettera azotonutricia (strain ATCC BAA-888 / DSM 13862 / ZAS-9) TaxID=545695 RepID=F5YES3_LEAAZ|nr:hypothetical protein [Leadbettera azotonutricia]AEF80708.1 putative lipoprotein [Leadbettera azotonutricia ZAS-9]